MAMISPSRPLGTFTAKAMAAPVFSRRILSLASVVAIVAFPTAALAHGGDENKIPEGKTISDDPIVREIHPCTRVRQFLHLKEEWAGIRDLY